MKSQVKISAYKASRLKSQVRSWQVEFEIQREYTGINILAVADILWPAIADEEVILRDEVKFDSLCARQLDQLVLQ